LLRDEKEWPDVRDAAVSFAQRLCIAPARETLTAVARLALRADATEDGVRLSLAALHALHDLGGDAAQDAAALAKRDSAPPGLAKAHAAFGPSACAQTP
jgi:hypothetical protein